MKQSVNCLTLIAGRRTFENERYEIQLNKQKLKTIKKEG